MRSRSTAGGARSPTQRWASSSGSHDLSDTRVPGRSLDTLVGMKMPRDGGTLIHADLDRRQAAEAFAGAAVVLVEGISDQLALEALAERRGRHLDAEGISIVPIGGSKNIGSF